MPGDYGNDDLVRSYFICFPGDCSDAQVTCTNHVWFSNFVKINHNHIIFYTSRDNLLLVD